MASEAVFKAIEKASGELIQKETIQKCKFSRDMYPVSFTLFPQPNQRQNGPEKDMLGLDGPFVEGNRCA
jgi:hypothetical protein